MAKTAYEWAEARGLAVSAQVVGETLEAIKKHKPTVTRRDLVEVAAAVDSPLHPYFEWDDANAGQKYREEQAGRMIRCIRQVTASGSQVPSFVRIELGGDGGYKDIGAAMADVDTRAFVLRDALGQLNALRERYESVDELAGVWEAVEKVKPARRRPSTRTPAKRPRVAA